jgi:hypothetical protein
MIGNRRDTGPWFAAYSARSICAQPEAAQQSPALSGGGNADKAPVTAPAHTTARTVP